MKLIYPPIFYPCTDIQNGYTVEVPDLPGCVSQGDTLADAIIMATDAASGWVLDEMEDGKPVPSASPITALNPSDGGIINLLALDMDAYAQRFGSKAIRKNCTLPAWMNTFAEENDINCSHVLQEALQKLYTQM